MDFSMIGPGIVLGLGCIGSSIGCGISGMASHGVMTHVEEGHGKFVGLAAMPASQSIYGIVLMILMKNALAAGTVTPLSAIGIALFAGLAIMMSAIYQGMAAATAIQAAAKQPAIFGKCAVAIGIIESFALFAFVFAYLLLA
jgi:V/A-type H+/Na+-transporting ATPase subunit K